MLKSTTTTRFVALLIVVLVVGSSVVVVDAKQPKQPPPPPPGESYDKNGVSFFFFGDWGSNVPASKAESGIAYEESKIAAQVNKFATKVGPKFIAALGDNFYNNGVVNTTDPLWNTVYKRLFTAPATFVPWYPVFGNHDYYGTHTPQAQIDYYYQHKDARWTFPDYQYTRQWNIPGSKQTMEIVFINTVTLCPEAKAGDIGWPPNPDAYPNPNAANRALDRLIWQPTYQWIHNALASSKADLLMVAGHYHIYTNTGGGDATFTPEAACLKDRLVPLLKKYGVTAYINGHEHNFEHFLVDGISYFTAGHGSDKEDPISTAKTHPAGLLYNKTIGGFAWANVKPGKLSVKFIDYFGKTLYTYDSKFRV